MKAKLIITAAVILVAIIAVLAFYLIRPHSAELPVQNPATNPFGTPAGTVTTTSGTSSDLLPVILNDGSTVQVPDFTKSNQPDWAGPAAGYQVAGSVTSDFVITYILPDPTTQRPQFLITLLAEPLGSVRLAAEQALRTALELSDTQLCALDTVVSAGPGVNDAYAGKSLGLSFCPGATKLPN
ncbi:MAG: hypothetical protein WDN10_01505 [bacterium]